MPTTPPDAMTAPHATAVLARLAATEEALANLTQRIHAGAQPTDFAEALQLLCGHVHSLRQEVRGPYRLGYR